MPMQERCGGGRIRMAGRNRIDESRIARRRAVNYSKDQSSRDDAPARETAGAHENRDGLPPLDPDLALLESYLDGELTSGELQSLQGRLSGDPELSAALSR